MSTSGKLKPGVVLKTEHDGGGKRCLFVKAPLEGKKWGEQCKNRCIRDRPRCKYHGGYAGRPPTTHAHSKYQPVPLGLQAKFEKAMEDQDLLNLWSKIALLDAQIWHLTAKAEQQDDLTPVQQRKLFRLIKAQKELIQQESVRRLTLGTMLPVEKLMIMVRYIYDSVLRNVPDRAAQMRIGSDLRRIITGGGGNSADVDSSMALVAKGK